MQKIKTYLVSRIFLLLFGGGIGLHQMLQAIQLRQWGAFLAGAGLFGFGVHWFLQPLVLGKREGAARTEVENAKLGSASMRKSIEIGSTLALIAGMLLRYGFHL